MNAHDASRRRFLKNASAGFLAAAASGGFGTSARSAQKAGTLAVLGGSPVRTEPFPAWPQVTPEIEQSLLSALRSRSWGRTLQGAMQGAGQVVELYDLIVELTPPSSGRAIRSLSKLTSGSPRDYRDSR